MFHFKKNFDIENKAHIHFNNEFKRLNPMTSIDFCDKEYRKNQCMAQVYNAMRPNCYYTPNMLADHSSFASGKYGVEFYVSELATALDSMVLVGFVSKHELPD